MDGTKMSRGAGTTRVAMVGVIISGIVLYGAFFHAPHLAGVWPVLLLPAVCLLMHVFLHGGHRGRPAHMPPVQSGRSPAIGLSQDLRQPASDASGTRRAQAHARTQVALGPADAVDLEHQPTRRPDGSAMVVNLAAGTAHSTSALASPRPAPLPPAVGQANLGARER